MCMKLESDMNTHYLSSCYSIKCDIRNLTTSTANLNKTRSTLIVTEDICKARSNRIRLLYGCFGP